MPKRIVSQKEEMQCGCRLHNHSIPQFGGTVSDLDAFNLADERVLVAADVTADGQSLGAHLQPFLALLKRLLVEGVVLCAALALSDSHLTGHTERGVVN